MKNFFLFAIIFLALSSNFNVLTVNWCTANKDCKQPQEFCAPQTSSCVARQTCTKNSDCFFHPQTCIEGYCY